MFRTMNAGGGMAMMQCGRSGGGAVGERARARCIAAAGMRGDDEVDSDGDGDSDGNIPEVLVVLGPPLVVGELDLLRSI
jgi:hypothetical protein